jgi:hypothetical protein
MEWCRPVPTEDAQELAARVPELTLRTEPAHREAFVQLGSVIQLEPAQWPVISESLQGWVEEHGAQASPLGVRLIYVANARTPEDRGPDGEFAVPLA